MNYQKRNELDKSLKSLVADVKNIVADMKKQEGAESVNRGIYKLHGQLENLDAIKIRFSEYFEARGSSNYKSALDQIDEIGLSIQEMIESSKKMDCFHLV